MINEIKALSAKLEKIVNTRIADKGVADPPRLVRANSAFDLYNALKKLENNPDAREFLEKADKG